MTEFIIIMTFWRKGYSALNYERKVQENEQISDWFSFCYLLN